MISAHLHAANLLGQFYLFFFYGTLNSIEIYLQHTQFFNPPAATAKYYDGTIDFEVYHHKHLFRVMS